MAILIAHILTVVLALTGGTTDTPSCPTEDSCSVDYRDGEWHIEEVTP